MTLVWHLLVCHYLVTPTEPNYVKLCEKDIQIDIQDRAQIDWWSEGPGFNPLLSWRLIMKYFIPLFASRWFKKGFWQKQCAQVLVNCFEDWVCQRKVWLGKLYNQLKMTVIFKVLTGLSNSKSTNPQWKTQYNLIGAVHNLLSNLLIQSLDAHGNIYLHNTDQIVAYLLDLDLNP